MKKFLMTTPSFLNWIFLLVRALITLITSELKLLKDKETIEKSTYKSIQPVGSGPIWVR